MGTGDPHRVSDAAVLSSLVETLRSQIVPALDDRWARAAAIQLAALAQMIRDRPADPGESRTAELGTLLREIGEPVSDDATYDDVLAACRDALAGFAEDDPRRASLRAVLIRHLDEDLAVNMPLLAAFGVSSPMRDALGEFLASTLGRAADVVSMARISVGHSRAMYRAALADGTSLIVRREQGGVFGSSSAEEYRVMAGLHAAGYPVAEVVAFEPTGEVLGEPFFVMKDLGSAAPGGDERVVDEAAARDFVRTLAALHAIDPATLPFTTVPDDPMLATHLQIDRWYDIYRGATSTPVPLLDDAAAWLHRHAPPLERLATVHGDAGPANFVHADGKVVAITDWEFVHPGDPAEDWVFCIAIRGVTTMSKDGWLALYADEVGVHLDEAAIRYWEVFNLFKGACANRTTLTIFERGTNRNPNMAIIGTTLHQFFLRRLVSSIDE